MARILPPRPFIEGDDHSVFHCGRGSINTWFGRQARSNHVGGASRENGITDEAGKIVGSVTLSAAKIERAFLPKPSQRNRPGPIPVTLLGQLAIDKAHQRQGHAQSLLLSALRTALRASETVGSMGAVAHPLDDSLRGFYARWGSWICHLIHAGRCWSGWLVYSVPFQRKGGGGVRALVNE